MSAPVEFDLRLIDPDRDWPALGKSHRLAITHRHGEKFSTTNVEYLTAEEVTHLARLLEAYL